MTEEEARALQQKLDSFYAVMDQEIGILKKQAVKARKEHGIIEDGELTCKTESRYNTNRLAAFSIYCYPLPQGPHSDISLMGLGVGGGGGGSNRGSYFIPKKIPTFFSISQKIPHQQ